MTVSRRVLALISTLALGGEAVGHGSDERLELLAGIAIDAQVAAERVADLVTPPSGVFAEDEHSALAAKLVDASAVVPRHRQNEVGLLDELARQQAGAVAREVQSPLESDEVRALGRRCAVPRARAGRRDVDVQPALLQGALEQ